MKGKPNIMRVVANKEMISSSLSILHMIKNYQDEGFIISGFNENELESKKSELIIKFVKRDGNK